MGFFDPNRPIIEFNTGDGDRSAWTLRHAVEGVQIFGGIGSGKTSGSGRMLALKYLSAGFGGLVLTVKPDEKEDWQQYCKLAGREDDLIIIEPGGQRYFNFLEYESMHASGESAITDNIVELLKTVIRAGNEKDSGKSDDAFWESALDILIFNVIDLCKLAYGKLSLQQMYDIVQTIPKENEELKNKSAQQEFKEFQKAMTIARNKVRHKIDQWQLTLSEVELELFDEDPEYKDAQTMETVPELRLFMFLDQFFLDSFKNLSDKTRSIIDFTFSGFLFRLLREPVYSLLCKHPSNVKPEDSLDGKIILLNLPVKLYHKVGRDSQILFKYIWQRAMEKRDTKINDRPVFLWADEAQNFLHEHDASFQATARSSRVATVYITQNLPNYYAAMGGEKAQFRVKSFLGTLATKIFHANADIETNTYASDLVGHALFTQPSKTVTMGEQVSQSQTLSLQLEKRIRPEEFICLRTGGSENNFMVEGYLHQQGKSLFGGQNHKKMNFNQNYKP